MSFTDRLLLWLHVAFVLFAIGPATAAIMATPRQIRARNVTVLRYLLRATRVYTVLTLGVAVFGVALGDIQKPNDLGKTWLTVSMTLFVVALVCLVLIMRDQSRALQALESAAHDDALAVAAASPPATTPADAGAAGSGADGADTAAAGNASPAKTPSQIANVERGRIASLGGLVALIWLVVLVLMVWNSTH